MPRCRDRASLYGFAAGTFRPFFARFRTRRCSRLTVFPEVMPERGNDRLLFQSNTAPPAMAACRSARLKAGRGRSFVRHLVMPERGDVFFLCLGAAGARSQGAALFHTSGFRHDRITEVMPERGDERLLFQSNTTPPAMAACRSARLKAGRGRSFVCHFLMPESGHRPCLRRRTAGTLRRLFAFFRT